MADIHVIEEHMRRLGEAAVLDAIEQTDFVAADIGLDAPVKAQVLTETVAWWTIPSAQSTQRSPSQRSP